MREEKREEGQGEKWEQREKRMKEERRRKRERDMKEERGEREEGSTSKREIEVGGGKVSKTKSRWKRNK